MRLNDEIRRGIYDTDRRRLKHSREHFISEKVHCPQLKKLDRILDE